MPKKLFAIFAIASALLFSNCSLLLNMSSDTGTLTLTLDGELFSKMKNTRAVSDEESNAYYFDIEINGGFSSKKTVELSSNGTVVSFEELPEGVTIWAEGTAYEVVDGEKIIRFVGKSNKLTISEGDNELSLVMKRYESNTTEEEEEEEIGVKFYVSANADSQAEADGSQEKPFASVATALNSLPTTSENIILILSGEFSTPITIPDYFALASDCFLTIRGGDSNVKFKEGFNSSSNSTVPITLKNLSVSSNIEISSSTKVTLYNVNATGQVIIDGNGQLGLKGSSVVGNGLSLQGTAAKVIVKGSLSQTTVATITPSEYTAGLQVLEVASDAGVTMSDVYKKFKITNDSDGNKWQINSSGELERIYIGTKKPTEARAIGDIIFNDGSASPYTETFISEQKSKAIAVIFQTGSTSYGIGLHNTYELYNSELQEMGLSKIFSDASSWANSYGSTYSISNYQTGWSIPTTTQASKVYSNKTIVQTALEKAGGTQLFESETGDGYWCGTRSNPYAIRFGNDGEPFTQSDESVWLTFVIHSF